MIEPKPLFIERIKRLMKDEKDFEKFMEYSRKPILRTIRCNTLKISPEKLKKKLELKGWKIEQPFSKHPEVMSIENLMPGELGKSVEHLLGYYYVQEISSMMPIIALDPKPDEIVLDLCASPGSKTTQASALMQNKGTLIANDKDMGRVSILSANLQRCGCSNIILTRHDGIILCERLAKLGMKFDKILLDVPCSGEGNTRSNPKTFLMWNINMIKKISRLQRHLAQSALPLLKESGTLVYSTCTYSPEENEANVSFLCEKFNLESEPVVLPLHCRQGMEEWDGERFSSEVKSACRIFPQDNNTEGFFLCKLRRRK